MKIFSLILLTVFLFSHAQNLIYNPILGSNMILQRDSDQTKLWGISTQNSGEINIIFTSKGSEGFKIKAPVNNKQWKVNLPKTPAGGPFNVTIQEQQSGQLHKFTNVYFGDVFLCSGQSNMEWPLSAIFNASEEISDAKNYPLLRLFHVARNASKEPLFTVNGKWDVSSPDSAKSFSAICYLFGRNVFKRLGGKVPIGMIESAWGGTLIEAWSGPDALKKCKNNAQGASTENQPNPNSPSYLWNGMIHPLLNVNIRGALWYQGESNHRNPEAYKCQFPAMISDWRTKFGVGDFYFYFVQLAAFSDMDFTALRWAQTWALKLTNTGMATAVDLGDPAGGIHPRNKQPVSERFENIAGHQIYGLNLPFTGPIIQDVKVSNVGNEFTFDVSFKYASEGLKTRGTAFCKKCCSDTSFIEVQQAENLQWIATRITYIQGDKVRAVAKLEKKPVAFRYLWSRYPECVLTNAASYLPSPPHLQNL